MWQEIFGTGLVKTPGEDFSGGGEPPSNPELLDWLAVDFREHGWDMKRFYKQIVMSAAYRQSAATTPSKIEKDPGEQTDQPWPALPARWRTGARLCAGGKRFAIAADQRYSVKPYQPDGVWEAVAMDGSNTRYYMKDQGDGLYRRSLYSFWKRSAPPASMDIFQRTHARTMHGAA